MKSYFDFDKMVFFGIVFVLYFLKSLGTSSFFNISPGIAFDGKGVQNLGNGFARNAVIFGVDTASSSQTDP